MNIKLTGTLMKNLILLSFLVVISVQPAIAAGKLDSVVAKSPSAIADVARDIKQWHNMEHPACHMKSVIAARIQSRDKDTSTEIWTVEGCDGKQFKYKVFIMAGPNGRGFSDSVGNADGSPFHVDKPS